MIANRVPRRSGGIVLGHVLNRKGTIEAETTVVRIGDDRFFFVLAAFFEARILDWLVRNRRPDEQIRIKNVSDAFGAVALQGRARARCSPG